jgi:hypothetical protein
LTEGEIPYHAIKPASSTRDIRRSTRPIASVLTGTIRRGKYTFEMMFAFWTRLPLPSMSAVAKKYQGSIAAKTSTG